MFVLLAMFVGVLTVVPLILFHAGNQLLSMTTASLLFYSNPTTQLLIATLLIGEAFEIRTCWHSGPFGWDRGLFHTRKPARPILPAG